MAEIVHPICLRRNKAGQHRDRLRSTHKVPEEGAVEGFAKRIEAIGAGSSDLSSVIDIEKRFIIYFAYCTDHRKTDNAILLGRSRASRQTNQQRQQRR